MPFILLTGQEDHDIDMEAMRTGASDFLEKEHISVRLLERSIRYAISHKRMEEQIRESSRMASIGQLAAGVAHEINNPLTSVLGYSQLLLAQDPPASIAADVHRIYAEAKRAAKVVQDLLLFARKADYEKRYIDISPLLVRAQDLMSHEFIANNITVINQVPPDLPRTMADEHQMLQVFLNLLANAEQMCVSSHGRGRLVIGATASPDTINISIHDDGPGIPPENVNRIFEPFFTTKDVGRGTGLGLSICYGIIRQHGGELWAESEDGKGATFHIALPLVQPEVDVEPPPTKLREILQSTRQLLVVDDEPLIRNLLTKFLETRRFTVDQAGEGEEAWRKVQTITYDCILLDLKMPGMGGRELYKLLEGWDKGSAEKVIFITGDTADPDTKQFLEATGNPVMMKPFELEALHHQVLELVAEPTRAV